MILWRSWIAAIGLLAGCATASDGGRDPGALPDQTSSASSSSSSGHPSSSTSDSATTDRSESADDSPSPGAEGEAGPGLIQAFLKSILQEKCGPMVAGVPAAVSVERLDTLWVCFEDLGWTAAPTISVTAPDGAVASVSAAPLGSAWQWRFVPGFGDPVVDELGQYSFSIVGPDGDPAAAPFSGTITVTAATQARMMATTILGPGETLHVVLAGYSPGSVVPHIYGPATPRDPVTHLSDYPLFADLDAITVGADGESSLDWTPPAEVVAGEYGFWLDPLPVNCRALCGFVLGP